MEWGIFHFLGMPQYDRSMPQIIPVPQKSYTHLEFIWGIHNGMGHGAFIMEWGIFHFLGMPQYDRSMPQIIPVPQKSYTHLECIWGIHNGMGHLIL
jgi:uncharacterized membrane protein